MSEYEKIPVDDALEKLGAHKEKGFSEQEVQERLKKYGPNVIEEKKKSRWLIFFSYFWGPIPWMIEIAVILSGILHHWPDFVLILTLLLFNAFLGFFHEYSADNAISALKNTLALKATALRQGEWKSIPAKDLVPGDIITMKLGNIIPADVKLLSGHTLSVDQSALTGESLPVDKKEGEMAFSGTIVKMGEMTGVVTETGMNTFFGKTAKLVQEAKTISHFQQAVLGIGRFLIITTLLIAAIILVYSVYRIESQHLSHHAFGRVAIFLLVLIVAGIPVALPAVVSVTMAIGASRMAKLKAIVSKLIAIEELAGMNILCSDKTGTLTKNQLTVGEVKGIKDAKVEDILLSAALASKREDADAIDQAIFAKVDEAKTKAFELINYVPFDPVKKRSEATVKADGGILCVSKGAPQMILELAKADEGLQKEVNGMVNEFASRGFRTLGVAKKDEKASNWIFLGLIPLYDPPREDTKSTLEALKEMDVHVKMVTGDHIAIAKEIAQTLGLGMNIYPMDEVFKEGMEESKKHQMLESADGFAQVFPEHKFEIVKTLESKKNIVGMTGDGVNDAPALKQADIGIAVGGATDAARAAADLVLTESGLGVITKAVEEARRIFGRMKSYVMYRISETCRLLLFLLLSMLIFDHQPLSAIMIIMIALLNDIPIMTIAYDNMEISPKPVAWNMKEVFTISVGLAVVGVVSTFGLYWIGDRIWHLDHKQCSTLAFMAILCGGNLTIYLTRNFGFVLDRPLPEWKFFCATLFSQIAGTLVSVYGLDPEYFVGLGWKYAGFAWVYIFVWFILCILTKYLLYKVLGISGKYKESFIDPTSSRIV